jgi:hypothetical protein
LFAQNPQASVNLFATDKEKRAYVPVLKADKERMFRKKTRIPLKQDDDTINLLQTMNPELYENLSFLGFVGVNPATINKFEHAINSADMILN